MQTIEKKSRQNKFDVQCLGEQMPHLLCTVTKASSNPAVMATLWWDKGG